MFGFEISASSKAALNLGTADSMSGEWKAPDTATALAVAPKDDSASCDTYSTACLCPDTTKPFGKI